MRTLRTSATLPEIPPTKPETAAMPMSWVKEGGLPSSVNRFFSSSYIPKRVVEYVICRSSEADSPLYKPSTPLFLTICTNVPLIDLGMSPVRI